MTTDQSTIPMPIASQRDLRARFALQQMEESGLVEKEATLTQPHGYDILTMDKAIAPVLAALYLYLGSLDALYSRLGSMEPQSVSGKSIPGCEYINACKELAKTCDPEHLAEVVVELLRTSSELEKRDLVGKLKWASNDPGVRWFLRTYLDTKPISWPEKISAAVELHCKGKEIMFDKSIPLPERVKYLLDSTSLPVKHGKAEVVTIKCLKKSDLKKFGKIPRFDECHNLLVPCEVPLTWADFPPSPIRTRDDIFFVSHKWDGLEPDPHQLIRLVAGEMKGDFLFWIDYCCTDQQEPNFEHIVSAMTSIPHVRLWSMTLVYNHYLFGLLSEGHSMSAWCQLEHALKPREFKRPLGLQLTKTIILHGEQSVTTFFETLSSLFCDREDVSDMSKAMILEYCSDLSLRVSTGETRYFEDIDDY